MLYQVTEGYDLRDFQRALDFVDPPDSIGLHPIRDIDMRVRPGATPDLICIHRRVQGMELQGGIPKPVPELTNLRFIPVIHVLRGAEYLDSRNARAFHPVQPRRRQTMVADNVR